MTRWIAAVMLCVLATACGSDDDGSSFVLLDGTPRVADHAGVLTALADDFSTMTVGGQTFSIDPDVQSFSTVDASATPLRRWRDQFVLVGLDGGKGTIQWMAGVSAVIRRPDEPPVAFLTDVLNEIDDGVAVFRSGTTLDVGAGVEPPSAPPVAVVATIDAQTGAITEFAPG